MSNEPLWLATLSHDQAAWRRLQLSSKRIMLGYAAIVGAICCRLISPSSIADRSLWLGHWILCAIGCAVWLSEFWAIPRQLLTLRLPRLLALAGAIGLGSSAVVAWFDLNTSRHHAFTALCLTAMLGQILQYARSCRRGALTRSALVGTIVAAGAALAIAVDASVLGGLLLTWTLIRFPFVFLKYINDLETTLRIAPDPATRPEGPHCRSCGAEAARITEWTYTRLPEVPRAIRVVALTLAAVSLIITGLVLLTGGFGLIAALFNPGAIPLVARWTVAKASIWFLTCVVALIVAYWLGRFSRTTSWSRCLVCLAEAEMLTRRTNPPALASPPAAPADSDSAATTK